MNFYLCREWVDQEDGIDRVFIEYAVTPVAAEADWQRSAQTRELIPTHGQSRKRRAKVIKLPRQLDGQENYLLHYRFHILGSRERSSEIFVEEIVSDDTFTFIDYWGQYTNICIYWSIDGWEAPNYSPMSEDGTGLDHPLNSLHFYGRVHDGVFIYERYKRLQSLALPRIYRGRVYGPRRHRVHYCYHIVRTGSPSGDDYEFWDNNQGLNYWKDLW